MKTMCFFCGKSHRTKKPKRCTEAGAKMSALVRQVPTWVVMRVLEVHGVKALDDFEVYAGQTFPEAVARAKRKRKAA